MHIVVWLIFAPHNLLSEYVRSTEFTYFSQMRTLNPVRIFPGYFTVSLVVGHQLIDVSFLCSREPSFLHMHAAVNSNLNDSNDNSAKPSIFPSCMDWMYKGKDCLERKGTKICRLVELLFKRLSKRDHTRSDE